MESMPLSGQHAARAKEFRGFANLEAVRRFAAFSGGIAAETSPFGNISPTFEKVGQNMGRRGAAPY